jgi:malate synthase
MMSPDPGPHTPPQGTPSSGPATAGAVPGGHPATVLAWVPLAAGVEIYGAAWTAAAQAVLVPAAVEILARLHRALETERQELLAARRERQAAWDAGGQPGYLDGEVSHHARGSWQISELPADLRCRRVEITGPASSPRMVLNMLSRGEDGARADAAMLDFEDSMKPTWTHVVQGVANVTAAAHGTLTFHRPAAGGQPEKTYRLDPHDMALLMVRCRGLHLDESNLQVDGKPVAGGLLDLALCAFHTAATLRAQGKTPKYYVPKCEHHLEARWWDRLFSLLEEALALPPAALRVTFLIETLPAAFQVEEILWELRRRAAACNVGRWDKIFSDIKVLREHADRVLADRASISLNRPWMRAYAERLIQVCHRHGAFAMGGMAAFTPGKSPELRAEQTRKVVEDKRFEAALGHDGCWVSHPYFIGPAMSAFTRCDQLDVAPELPERPDLLPQGTPPRTLAGLRKNLRVGIAYLKGWNEGLGVIAWDDLMEDLATLEISRAQTWQWLRHGVALDDGPRVTRDLVGHTFGEELDTIEGELRQAGAAAAEVELYRRAARDAEAIFTESEFRPFLASRSELAGDGHPPPPGGA